MVGISFRGIKCRVVRSKIEKKVICTFNGHPFVDMFPSYPVQTNIYNARNCKKRSKGMYSCTFKDLPKVVVK